MSLLHQLQELAFAHDGVSQIESCKLDLPRSWIRKPQLFEDPVIKGTMHLKLQGAQRMGDSLDGIAQAMGEIIHWVNRPGISRTMVVHLANTVERWIPQMNVGRSHVDLGSQGFGAILEVAPLHGFQKGEVLLHTAFTAWALLARSRGCPASAHEIFCGQVAYVGFSRANQLLSIAVELFKIVAGIKRFIPPLKTQPRHILHDGIHILGVLTSGIGIIKAKVAGPLRLLGNAKIQTDGLGVTDVEVTVGFRRKPGHDTAVFAFLKIVMNDFPDEVLTGLILEWRF